MKPQSTGVGAQPSDGIAPVDTHSRGIRAPSTWFDSSRELASGLDVFELSTDVRLFDLMYELQTANATLENETGSKR